MFFSWTKNIFNKTTPTISHSKENSDLLKKLNESSKEQSDYTYEKHEQELRNFNPLVEIVETDNNPLTSVEISFLDYIAGKKINNLILPVYWTYEYNVNFKYLISKLINNGYLRISALPSEFNKLTVSELKEILKHFNLKVSGKKDELILRIKNEINPKELEKYFSNSSVKYFSITEKGKTLVNNQPKSITKDIDFEDDCLELINKFDFNAAYRLVCERELNKKFQRGLGINWERELENGLSKASIESYQKLMNFNSEDIPKEVTKIAITTYIFYKMLGKRPDDVLFNRLTNHKYKDSAKTYISIIQYEEEKNSAENQIKELKNNSYIQYYKILTCKDERVCSCCAKIGRKKHLISEAEVGLNFPPFHQGCRCTVICVFDD